MTRTFHVPLSTDPINLVYIRVVVTRVLINVSSSSASSYFPFLLRSGEENPSRQEALTEISTRPGPRERRGRAFVFNNASAAALSLTFRTSGRARASGESVH